MDIEVVERPTGRSTSHLASQGKLPCLLIRDVHKRFGGSVALDGVSLELHPGEIHSLVGENGAGKSTLINIATGLIQPDEGRLELGGTRITPHSPREAGHLGILAVHQEADLFAELSLAENMLLGEGLRRRFGPVIDWRATFDQAQRELNVMAGEMDVRAPARSLNVGRRVLAEIAAAIARRPMVLFLDEPTASLTHGETCRLMEQLQRLRDSGVAIIYVSHRLEEVLDISDKITVLRDGRTITTRPAVELDVDQLVTLMAGRALHASIERNPLKRGPVVFEAKQLTDPAGRFRNVSFRVHAGEILGMYGLVGAGRSEVAQAIFGLSPHAGTLELDGKPVNIPNPGEALKAGIGYLPEDRLLQGVFANHACRLNLTSAIGRLLGRGGWISHAREGEIVAHNIERLKVRLTSPEQPINTLSGGNQQKLILGRWLETHPRFLILDEPTRGVDVGAKVEIHRIVHDLARQGVAVLLISSDLPEVLQLSDRVITLVNGEVGGRFDNGTIGQDEIVAASIPRARNSVDTPGADAAPRRLVNRLPTLRESGILIALAGLCLLLGVLKPAEFLTVKNLLDVMTSASIVSVVAAGMMLVIVAGGIDISVGSMLGLVGAVAALAARQGLPPAGCLALATCLGAMLGGLNSAFSTLGRVHPIIITLAGISIYRGIMLQLTGGYEISDLPAGYRALADGSLVLPKMLLYALLVLGAGWVFLNHTITGRYLLAQGNSEKAARLIGLVPWKLKLTSFMMLGALVGLAAIMWGAYYGKIQSNTGEGLELQAIAAAVIGGCSITGGRGTALGTFLGAVLIALIYNCLIILKISAYWQSLFVGALILVAVLADLWLSRIAVAATNGRMAPCVE